MIPLSDLEILIRSWHPLIFVETHEEERLQVLVEEVAVRLGVPIYTWTATEGLRRGGTAPGLYDSRAPLKALQNIASLTGVALYLLKDFHRYLEEAVLVRKVRDLCPAFSRDGRTLIISGPSIAVPAELQRVGVTFRLDLPGEPELKELVERSLPRLAAQHRVRFDLTAADRERIVDGLRGLTLAEGERALARLAVERLTSGRPQADILLQVKKEMIERDGLLEFIPQATGLNAVGGLARLKGWLATRRAAFTAEARAFGVEAPRGVLLLGVQGCGKSSCVKAVAREWGLPLLRLEATRLYDKYIGESEKNLERVLAVSEGMAPVVLWIDEIEKGFAYSRTGDSDAGLSKRLFGRILTWLQERKSPVFLVATCNDVGTLPPELMRKGRFDEVFFVDLPGAEERTEILRIHLARRKRDPARFDLAALAAASEGFSGAELEQAIVAALHAAFSRKTELTTDLILEELRNTRPLSVLRREEIDALRTWAAGRTVPAS
ncbi:MAG: AAA family ATPase [Candidatus Methylomirabilales bacterium]